MKKILFTGKFHRVRRRETIMNPPKGIKFVTQQPLDAMGHDYQLSSKTNKIKTFRMKDFFVYNNYIPNKYLKNVDMIYSPGKIILNKFPWVVEIDNVSVLAYYNLKLLKILKFFLRSRLRSRYCKKIICISEAAKHSVINYFNDETITNKCVVVYPYVEKAKIIHKSHKKIKFLYISTHFYLKGGKEIIRAFKEVSKKYPNIELDIISNTPQEIIDKYSSLKNIRFIPAKLEKNEIYSKFYSNTDVFLQLSYQDSFGLVNLEAISAGIPIIATDMFAIPEIVEEGKNGFLINSPIQYFNSDYLPNPKFWNISIDEFAKKNNFPAVERELIRKIEILLKKPKLRKKMSDHAIYLVTKGKFCEKQRLNALKHALQ